MPGSYSHMDVRATPGAGSLCPSALLPVSEIKLAEERGAASTSFRVTGRISNDRADAETGISVTAGLGGNLAVRLAGRDQPQHLLPARRHTMRTFVSTARRCRSR